MRFFTRPLISGVVLTFVSMAIFGCSSSHTPSTKVAGEYQVFNNLRPHSLDAVRLDVYEDFTCPACQQFSNDFLPQFMVGYGKRLVVVKHYLAGSGSPVYAQVLYDVAARHGAGEEAASLLFSANLDHHSAAKNAPAVQRIANDLGLLQEYKKALSDPNTAGQIRSAWNVEGANITFLPSIVVTNILLTDSNPKNIATILNSLLKDPVTNFTVDADPKGGFSIRADESTKRDN